MCFIVAALTSSTFATVFVPCIDLAATAVPIALTTRVSKMATITAKLDFVKQAFKAAALSFPQNFSNKYNSF